MNKWNITNLIIINGSLKTPKTDMLYEFPKPIPTQAFLLKGKCIIYCPHKNMTRTLNLFWQRALGLLCQSRTINPLRKKMAMLPASALKSLKLHQWSPNNMKYCLITALIIYIIYTLYFIYSIYIFPFLPKWRNMHMINK